MNNLICHTKKNFFSIGLDVGHAVANQYEGKPVLPLLSQLSHLFRRIFTYFLSNRKVKSTHMAIIAILQ